MPPIDRTTLDALVGLIEYKDASTAAHTWRVVLYAIAVADALEIDDALMPRIAQAAALHDVGKIDIPSTILRKPGPLTNDEMLIVKRHPIIGFQRLRSLGIDDPLILDLVRYHHERWDGTGYPDGLQGEQIPLDARFFAVIDVFDALTSVRPYRKTAGPDAAPRAIEIIHQHTGTHYDPTCVEVFTDLYEASSLDWILNYFNTRDEMHVIETVTEITPPKATTQRPDHDERR